MITFIIVITLNILGVVLYPFIKWSPALWVLSNIIMLLFFVKEIIVGIVKRKTIDRMMYGI